MHGVLKSRVGGRKTRNKHAIVEFPKIEHHKTAQRELVGKKVMCLHKKTQYTGRIQQSHGLSGKVVVRFNRPVPQQAIQERIAVTVV